MATLPPFGLFGAADPFRELRRIQTEMDRVMSNLPVTGEFAAAGAFPAVNIYAGQEGIAVVAELPGVAADDLEIQAHNDTLTLRGTRTPAAEQRDAYHRRERRSGSFTRSIHLPYRIDAGRIEAHLDNGVLRLSLPRPEEDKPRRIPIRG